MKHVAVYGCYLTDVEKLKQSASGGIATAMAEQMLDRGGYVAGVAFTEDFYGAEYILVHEREELSRLKGSKYFTCQKNGIYGKVRQLLEAGEQVLFFGLPCAVAALYKTLGSRPENLLTCELVCHGTMDEKYHREYVEHLEKKFKSKVVFFSARYKKAPGGHPHILARFENGREFLEQANRTEYGHVFATLATEPCYRCTFKDDRLQGDIMIGDFQGATPEDAWWNAWGMSTVFAGTERGDAFVRGLSGVARFPTTFERAVKINRAVLEPRKKTENQARLAALLEKEDMFTAVRHSRTWLQRMKLWVLRRMPK